MRSFKMKNAIVATSLLILCNITFAESSMNWTGIYGGLNAGFIFNDVDVDSNHLGFTNPSGTCNASSNFSSFFPGIQLGYAHQYNSKIVLGIEGDYTYNINQSTTVNCTCPNNSNVSDRFPFKNRQQASIRGRIGYALSHQLLPFVSLGGSVADLGFQYSNEGGNNYSNNTRNAGWLAGAGLEWGFLKNWSVRAEYYYADYGHVNLSIPTIYGLNDPNGSGSAKLTTHNIMAAVSYWF